MRAYVCVYETPWARKELPRARELASRNIRDAALTLGIEDDRLATAMRLLHTTSGQTPNATRVDDEGNILCPRCGAEMHLVRT